MAVLLPTGELDLRDWPDELALADAREVTDPADVEHRLIRLARALAPG